jgi:hypothetical protein
MEEVNAELVAGNDESPLIENIGEVYDEFIGNKFSSKIGYSYETGNPINSANGYKTEYSADALQERKLERASKER